jgi:hypothetical protein
MSTPSQQFPTPPATVERRFYSRVAPQTPLYVAINEDIQGLLLNVSENGLLLSTPTVLPCNFVARIAVSLDGLPRPVQVNVRVVWTSEARKLAGIQLLDLTEHDREQIRKWSAQASASSSQREPNALGVVTSATTARAERTPAASAFTKLTKPRAVASPAAQPPVQTQPASAGTKLAKWCVLIIAVGLAAVFLFKTGALGNPFVRSTENRHENVSVSPYVQDARPHPQNRDATIPNAADHVHVAATAPDANLGHPQNALESKSASLSSAETDDDTDMEDDAGNSAVDVHQNHIEGPPPTPAPTGEPRIKRNSSPAGSPLNSANPVDVSPEMPPVSSGSVAIKEAPQSPVGANALATVAPAPTAIPSRSNIAPPSAALPRNSVAPVVQPVIQMDPPARQVMEIRVPSGYRASFFNLPGERLLESSSTTMRIQRSVRLSAAHGWWSFHREKRVLVGQLISRVDPQVPQVRPGLADFVHVSAMVGADGRIESVRPIHGPVGLVPAVVKAVHEWRYQPTLIDGKPVQTQCDVVVQFHAPATRVATH